MLYEEEVMSFSDDENVLLEDDYICLTDDDAKPPATDSSEADSPGWKVMVVDDDVAVHQATKLALKNFCFENKQLTIISAYSGEEAKKIIADRPDTAFILLDVVMETNDAGLQVVKYIREELKNQQVRVILRTGQPGDAPEESVIVNYDINDYKLKVELTRQKLITTAISALRSYRDVVELTESRRTLENQKNKISQTLRQLEQTHIQLIQAEKMSALGHLLAGVTHEINNPVGCIMGNLEQTTIAVKDLIEYIELYSMKFPDRDRELAEKAEEIDLEFITEDLPKMLASMKAGSDRIYTLCTAMRTFSRADRETKVLADIHDGINSTLRILQYRLKANSKRPAIQVISNCDNLPKIRCYLGQLNQVFMNVLVNAIDALEESNKGKTFEEIEATPNQIFITTKMAGERNIEIEIKDNGLGMDGAVQDRIFDHLFTTKAVGKGTGLGLSISKQIVEETHGGCLTCTSVKGEGTEFAILLPID
ncbi:MAG: hybrid sensor histidine kinase/response regulator [Oscillatoriaceae cyanobacterium Prado104]|jgi:signal transduction histidine kinase|nr:hybrid sensor histidine kinase/response regulator [Oscillatoriaceae cyanobacterium Prado104]